MRFIVRVASTLISLVSGVDFTESSSTRSQLSEVEELSEEEEDKKEVAECDREEEETQVAETHYINLEEIMNSIIDGEAVERREEAAKVAKAMQKGAGAPHPPFQMESNPFDKPDFNPNLASFSPALMEESSSNKKLDLHKLAAHIEASLPALQHVVDKDVLILLGNTGVGKSLLIQAVAGRPVRRKSYCSGVGSHGEQLDGPSRLVWDVEDPMDGFAVGHDQWSETKSIRPFCTDSVVYLDAPGCAAAALVCVLATLVYTCGLPWTRGLFTHITGTRILQVL